MRFVRVIDFDGLFDMHVIAAMSRDPLRVAAAVNHVRPSSIEREPGDDDPDESAPVALGELRAAIRDEAFRQLVRLA